MVFEYAELDLEIVIQSPVVRTIDEPRQKSIVQQIWKACTTCTRTRSCTGTSSRLITRKRNCLITRKGRRQNLRLWFGVSARYKPGHAYTLPVVTLNYRPPGVAAGLSALRAADRRVVCGCYFAELLKREIVITGRDEGDYLQKLYALCGTPRREVDWPEARKVCKHWREACGVRGVEDKVTTDPYPVAASVPRRRRVLEAFAEESRRPARNCWIGYWLSR